MGRLAGVLLVVCVCLLLSVSLVQSRRRRSIPRFCKQFINPRAQANDVADVDKVDTASSEGDDEDDDDDYDEDYDYSSDEDEEVEFDGPIQVAEEEVNMLHLVIDFMTFNTSEKIPEELLEVVEKELTVEPVKSNMHHRAGEDVCVRKEYRMLTGAERQAFHDALQEMQRTMVRDSRGRSLSEYHLIASIHQFEFAPGAHNGPAFIPWHREYIYRFELLVQEHCPRCCLPYFDSRLDYRLRDARQSSFWAADMMGNNDGRVRSGPAANWPVYPPECRRDQRGNRTPTVTRRMSRRAANTFFRHGDVEFVRNQRDYARLCVPYNSRFERRHGLVHSAIGGHLGSLSCATSDIFFFLLHAGVDYYFHLFTQNNERITYPRRRVPNNQGARENMRPFDGLVNEDGLTRSYTSYEQSPYDRRCSSDSDCRPSDGSGCLWCNRRIRRCMAMVEVGGDCTGMTHNGCRCPEGTRPQCRRRTCICLDTQT